MLTELSSSGGRRPKVRPLPRSGLTRRSLHLPSPPVEVCVPGYEDEPYEKMEKQRFNVVLPGDYQEEVLRLAKLVRRRATSPPRLAANPPSTRFPPPPHRPAPLAHATPTLQPHPHSPGRPQGRPPGVRERGDAPLLR